MIKLVSFVLLLVIHNIEGIEVLSLFHSLVFSITWMPKPGVQNRCQTPLDSKLLTKSSFPPPKGFCWYKIYLSEILIARVGAWSQTGDVIY